MPCVLHTVHSSSHYKATNAGRSNGTLVPRDTGSGSAGPAVVIIICAIAGVLLVSLIWCWAKRSNAKAEARRRNAAKQGGYRGGPGTHSVRSGCSVRPRDVEMGNCESQQNPFQDRYPEPQPPPPSYKTNPNTVRSGSKRPLGPIGQDGKPAQSIGDYLNARSKASIHRSGSRTVIPSASNLRSGSQCPGSRASGSAAASNSRRGSQRSGSRNVTPSASNMRSSSQYPGSRALATRATSNSRGGSQRSGSQRPGSQHTSRNGAPTASEYFEGR